MTSQSHPRILHLIVGQTMRDLYKSMEFDLIGALGIVHLRSYVVITNTLACIMVDNKLIDSGEHLLV
jgi:hypothetical protein